MPARLGPLTVFGPLGTPTVGTRVFWVPRNVESQLSYGFPRDGHPQPAAVKQALQRTTGRASSTRVQHRCHLPRACRFVWVQRRPSLEDFQVSYRRTAYCRRLCPPSLVISRPPANSRPPRHRLSPTIASRACAIQRLRRRQRRCPYGSNVQRPTPNTHCTAPALLRRSVHCTLIHSLGRVRQLPFFVHPSLRHYHPSVRLPSLVIPSSSFPHRSSSFILRPSPQLSASLVRPPASVRPSLSVSCLPNCPSFLSIQSVVARHVRLRSSPWLLPVRAAWLEGRGSSHLLPSARPSSCRSGFVLRHLLMLISFSSFLDLDNSQSQRRSSIRGRCWLVCSPNNALGDGERGGEAVSYRP
jgi:hypothetical protein